MKTQQINWSLIESEFSEHFNSFKSFLTNKNIPVEKVDKDIFNTFIIERNFPVYLKVPEDFEMSDYVVKTTFSGLDVFLNMKK
jgi:hypothetical protein